MVCLSAWKVRTVTIEELEALMKRAEVVTGCKINISRDTAGHWSVYSSGMPETRDRYGVEFGDCVALLKQWATPPKPDFMTIANIPTAHIEWYAKHGRNPEFSRLCSEALKPYQIPE
jgi:hypothetical protein